MGDLDASVAETQRILQAIIAKVRLQRYCIIVPNCRGWSRKNQREIYLKEMQGQEHGSRPRRGGEASNCATNGMECEGLDGLECR